MKINTLALLVAGLLWCNSGSLVYGQEKTKLFLKPSKDSITLKWIVYDIPTWAKNRDLGYDVYRKSSDGTVTRLNDTLIRALKPEEFPWRYFKKPAPIEVKDSANFKKPDIVPQGTYTPDSLALKAVALFYMYELGAPKESFEFKEGDLVDWGDDPQKIQWLFHTILCMTHNESAIVSGLFFVDKKINPKENYTYYLTTHGQPIERALAQASVKGNDQYLFQKPKGLRDFTNKRKAFIYWKKSDTLNVFIPTYNVYRSDKKDGVYTQINQRPVFALYSGDSQRDSTELSYCDSTIEKGKVYFYKIRAVDVFEGLSPYSDPLKITEKELIERAPYMMETIRLDNPIASRIRWGVDTSEWNNIYSFQVYRSRKADSLFAPVSPVLKKDVREYIDKNPSKNNYYKVLTVGMAGDSLWTSPSYVMVPDSIPPLPSVIKQAICDSNGVVKITWKYSKDLDLHAFKIYRANYANEEFSRIAEIERLDTVYYDTISLATTTEQVYYKMLSYDDSYNPSEFSNVMKAKRYDIIPPVHPVFHDLRSDSTGIHLKWANSSSEDVIKTVLYRKLRDEATWHEYKTYARDTALFTSFTDTSLYRGQWYQYTLQSFDDDKLLSGFTPQVELKALDNGVRPAITKVTNKLEKRKKINKLKWVYNQQGVQWFQVYRATDNGELTILKSVAPTEFEYYDTNLTAGRTYHYRIKAVFLDGGESPFTKDFVVEF